MDRLNAFQSFLIRHHHKKKINCKNSSEAKISTQPPVNWKEVINNPGKLEK